MKKIITLLLVFILHQITFGQKKEIIIIDNSTKLPVENVNLYYEALNEGTFTNAEGKASINVRNSELKISNTNYEELVINAANLDNDETIYITPKPIQLNEVIISNFNLSKSLKYVLDNYDTLYVNIPFEKECDFKETVTVDNKLKRLIISKVNWWDKSYNRKKNDLKLRLGAIDYNKNNSFEIFNDVPRLNTPSKNGYVITNSIINTIYLNILLTSFITNGNNLKVEVERSPTNVIVISYSSDWKKTDEESYRMVGKITFDQTTKAIVEFIYDIENENSIKKSLVKETNKESLVETKKSSIKINFNKSLNNKWSLESYTAKVDMGLTYGNKAHEIIFENKIYVLKETAVKKVNNDGLIDLTKPIFQSLPSKTISNSNSILLTEEERKFIYSSK